MIDEILLDEAKDRLKHHLVMHPHFQRCVDRLERSFRSCPKRKGKHLHMLIGYTGAGKSSAVSTLMERFPPQEHRFGKSMPIVHATLPNEATYKAVVTAIFDAMGYKAPGSTNRFELAREIATKAKALETRLIVIDEAQHIPSGTPKRNTDFLKSLRHALPCDLLLVGLPSLEKFKFAEGQLFRRSDLTLHLRQYGLRDAWEQQQFLSLLDNLDDALGLPERSGLAAPDTARRLYAASDGLPGIIAKILGEALEIAMELSAPNLSLATLGQGYERDNARIFEDEKHAPFDALLGAFEGLDEVPIARSKITQDWIETSEVSNPFVCPPAQLPVIHKQRRHLLQTIKPRFTRQRVVAGEVDART